jgi:DNA-3-methyladenine glycosylase
LIRALQPTAGIPLMVGRRRQRDLRMLCSGPGKLGQALGIAHRLNGMRLDRFPFSLRAANANTGSVVCGRRIGISKAVDQPWRFGLANSGYLSRPFR